MTTGAPYPRLVGDIGGTHARFGWVQDAGSGITEALAPAEDSARASAATPAASARSSCSLAFSAASPATSRSPGYLERIPNSVILDASGLALQGATAALDA